MLPAAALMLLSPPAQAPAPLLDRCRYAVQPDTQWVLPPALAEISGLALAAPRRLLTHDDEHGRVYQLDPRSGRITAAWPLAGEPRDDFEGIALAGERVYLLTGGGRLYHGAMPAAAGYLAAQVVDTRLGRECELEGLAWDAAGGVLLMPCKELRSGSGRRQVAVRIYRWDPQTGRLAPRSSIEVSERELEARTPWRRFAPSSIEVDPVSGHLLLLSGRTPGLLELDGNGRVVAARALSPGAHRQPEGLTLSEDHDLVISDEAGRGAPLLSRYRCRP